MTRPPGATTRYESLGETMADQITPEERSQVMRRVKGRDTGPEKIVRSLLHAMGYRFRLHVADLPGKPDVVLPRHRKIVLVNGCFWHGHEGCKESVRPASNAAYWNSKIDRNIARDAKNIAALQEQGWQVLVVWECQTRPRDREELRETLRHFLTSTGGVTPSGKSGKKADDRALGSD